MLNPHQNPSAPKPTSAPATVLHANRNHASRHVKAKGRRITAALLLGVAVLSAGYGYRLWYSESTHAEAATLPVAHPWHKTLTINSEYVAQIKAAKHIELRSFEKGYLQKIFVDEGQMIEKDQPMFQLMPLLLEAKYKKAAAEYDLSRIEYNNTLLLEQRKVVSPAELALAKAKLDKAKAEMDLGKTHLDLTTVKAPFAGIMDRFHVRPGSLVKEGTLLTALSDNRKMWVYFNVSESDYLNYMEKKKNSDPQPVKLMLANGHLFPQEGQVDTIEADFNNETGNVAFRASFSNPDGLLRHGQTGTVLLPQKIDDALVIPQKATFEVLDKKFVYVVDEGGALHMREIKIAQEVPHLFVIKSGLSEGDTVLLEGLGKAQEGLHIQAKMLTADKVLSTLDLPVD